MPGSLTNGFFWSRWRWKRSRHSRRMHNAQIYVSGKRPVDANHFTAKNILTGHKLVINIWAARREVFMSVRTFQMTGNFTVFNSFRGYQQRKHQKHYNWKNEIRVSRLVAWRTNICMRLNSIPWSYGVCCIGASLQFQLKARTWLQRMMTSSNGNIFRVTGHLCGEFTGPRWISRTKASDAELWCFLWSASE